jgi:hypothetical protein
LTIPELNRHVMKVYRLTKFSSNLTIPELNLVPFLMLL